MPKIGLEKATDTAVSEFTRLIMDAVRSVRRGRAGEAVGLRYLHRDVQASVARVWRGRNPKTGEDLVIGAHRVVRFRSSPVLTGVLNGR